MKKIFCYLLVGMMAFCAVLPFLPNTNVVQATEDAVYADTIGISPLGGTIIATTEERIDYAYKSTEYYSIPMALPTYLSPYTCGITAGGAAIGYFDTIYEELIPNHTTKTILGVKRYGNHGDEVSLMHDQLYVAMNATPQGVTEPGYKTGFASYAASKGRTTSFSSIRNSNGTINNSYKAAFNDGKVLTLFLNGFNVLTNSDMRTYDGYDINSMSISTGLHIMIAYGYLEINYFNSSNQNFRTDTYLYVHTGFTIPTLAFLYISKNCIIDACYITNIY